MPKISVIVPAYNVEKTVAGTLKSIQNQTFSDFEAIIVNDGSTDNTADVAKNFADTDLRFSLISKQNGGLTSARLEGFKHANGDYIIFIDSDDVMESAMLSDLISAIEEKDADVSMCSYFVVYGENKNPVTLPVKTDFIECDRLIDDYILPTVSHLPNEVNFGAFIWLRLFKRDIITDDCFLSEREYFNEDLLFNMQSVKNMKKGVAVVNRPLYNYIQTDGSLTLKYRNGLCNKLKNKYSFCSEYFKDFDTQGKAQERLLYQQVQSAEACIRNAIRLSDKSAFKKEMDALYADGFFADAIGKYKNLNLNFKSKLIMYLTAKRFTSALWILLKK